MTKSYPRIPEERYRKLVFQLRGQYSAVLNVFNCYGMNEYVIQATEECVKLAENFAMAVRGKDAPIHILQEPKERGI